MYVTLIGGHFDGESVEVRDDFRAGDILTKIIRPDRHLPINRMLGLTPVVDILPTVRYQAKMLRNATPLHTGEWLEFHVVQ